MAPPQGIFQPPSCRSTATGPILVDHIWPPGAQVSRRSPQVRQRPGGAGQGQPEGQDPLLQVQVGAGDRQGESWVRRQPPLLHHPEDQQVSDPAIGTRVW